MTGQIVVGLDESPASAAALEWAIDRARRGGEALLLVSSYNPPAAGFYGYAVDPTPLSWLEDHARAIVEAAAQRVRDLAPETAISTAVATGPTAQILIEAAAGADALVIGRRGLGPARSALLGSVSNQITVQAACPVVVVGDHDLVPASGPIVVGFDGSEHALAALRVAVREAAVRGVGVRVVTAAHQRDELRSSDPELTARLRAAVLAEADEAAQGALDSALSGAEGVPVESFVEAERPADAILLAARDAQLIVVGSHGKGLTKRLILGSVSREILQSADRPVAVVDLPAGSD